MRNRGRNHETRKQNRNPLPFPVVISGNPWFKEKEYPSEPVANPEVGKVY
jgi:hypothetical protein